MTTYATQVTDLDLSGAGNDVRMIPVSTYHAEVAPAAKIQRLTHIAEALKDFSAQDDLLLVGDPVNIGLAFHIAATAILAEGGNSLNVLRWDRHRDAYVKVEVML